MSLIGSYGVAMRPGDSRGLCGVRHPGACHAVLSASAAASLHLTLAPAGTPAARDSGGGSGGDSGGGSGAAQAAAPTLPLLSAAMLLGEAVLEPGARTPRLTADTDTDTDTACSLDPDPSHPSSRDSRRGSS